MTIETQENNVATLQEPIDETQQPEKKPEDVEPTTDDLKAIIRETITLQVKFKETDVIFRTTMQISGRWETAIKVYSAPMAPVYHETPLCEHDARRDKELFLSDLSALLHTNKPYAKILMANVVAEAQKQADKFTTITQAYNKIAEFRNLSKQEDDDKRLQEQSNRPEPKLQGCFVPDGYEILTGENHHVCGETVFYTFTAKGEPREIQVCKCKAMVTGLHNSYDSDKTLVELVFTVFDSQTKGAVWKTIVVPLSSITTKDGFKKDVLSKGFLTQEININATIAYLEACIATNVGKEGSNFKSTYVNERTGWADNTFTAFRLGNRIIRDIYGKAVVEDAICINEELVFKLTPTGTIAEWIKAVDPVAHFYRIRFLMYDAMASLLLRILKISPHAGMLIYPTSQGKTTALQVIASLFGNPDEFGSGLLYNGDISITGANAILHMYYDLPVLIDETTNANERFRKTFAYFIGNAQSPVRGKQDSSLRDRDNHMSNAYIAAEESMVPEGLNDGGNNRATPFYERFIPADNGAIVEAAKLGMQYNYGHIIELFIGKIYANRVGLRAYFERAKARLIGKAKEDRIKRQAATFAAAELAGILLEQVFHDIGMKAHPMTPEAITDAMWKECTVDNIEKPMAEKALYLFHEWYMSNFNQHGLLHDETTETYEKGDDSYGIRNLHKSNIFIWDDGTWIDVLKAELDKEFTRKGYTNLNGIYKPWKATYRILETNHGYQFQAYHCKSVDSTVVERVMVVRILRDKMNELLGFAKEHANEPNKSTGETKNTVNEVKHVGEDPFKNAVDFLDASKPASESTLKEVREMFGN
jgi:hypothetical protein